MPQDAFEIITARLRLRPWRDSDRRDVAELNSDPEVMADNQRSQDVMRRLGLRRDESRDFTGWYEGYGSWSGLVWAATRDRWGSSGSLP